jgi:hypothetical protein
MSHMRHADEKGGHQECGVGGGNLHWDVAYATCGCKRGGIG